MIGIGQQLQRKREASRISLHRIHSETRISTVYLEALEEERFDVFPAEIYLVGFLRKYASYLGLDAEVLVAQYHGQKSRSLKHDRIEQEQRESVEKEASTISVQQSIFLTAVILLGFGILVSVFFFVKNKPALIESDAEPKVKRFLFIPDMYQEKRIPLELLVTAKNRSWIRIDADGKKVFEGLLPDASSEHWKARDSFIVIAQDWDDITLKLNGNYIQHIEHIDSDKHRLKIDRTFIKKL